MVNWWPVSDEEWEKLNFPEKFNKPVDKQLNTMYYHTYTQRRLK